MSCTYTYKGRTYNAWQFVEVLSQLPEDEFMSLLPEAGKREFIMASEKKEDTRFFSQLRRSFNTAPDKVFGQASQVKAWLLANKSKFGIKDDEIQWTGIGEWLDLQGKAKVTKQQVLDYLDHGGVKVEEVMKGEKDTAPPFYKWLESKGITESVASTIPVDERESLRKQYEDEHPVPKTTKYHSYTLPGGENYRELLLTLPTSKAEKLAKMNAFDDMLRQKYPDTNPIDWRDFAKYSQEDQNERERLRAEYAEVVHSQYKSSHWDEPNIIAHVRFNDRVDADGNKVLFIEELQGDWPQQYRKQVAEIGKAVDNDFLGIVERMEKDGVLEVECD